MKSYHEIKTLLNDEKGFAITTFLYSIFVVFLVVLSVLITNMINSKLTIEKLKQEAKKKVETTDFGEGNGTGVPVTAYQVSYTNELNTGVNPTVGDNLDYLYRIFETDK